MHVCEKEEAAPRETARGAAASCVYTGACEFTCWIIGALITSPAPIQIYIWKQIILRLRQNLSELDYFYDI